MPYFNGLLEFLIMHRAMIELLRNEFPPHAALFDGWANVPTDPADPDDPLPGGATDPFNADMQIALNELHNNLARFADDDAFGRYVETSWRPTPSAPFARDPDAAAGIHNYVHGRFTDPDSEVDMGNPEINLGNQRFWRLHGWIDARWTAFRAAKGLAAETAAIRASINAHKRHLSGSHIHHRLMRAELVRPERRLVPRTISQVFRESLAREFHRLTSHSDRPRNLCELKDWLQLAMKIEHFTIPLYLCAVWSLKGGSASAKHRGVILRIAFQEMLHMGLICNLLVALDDTPRIKAAGMAPTYPDQVPGLDVADVFELKPYSKEQIEQFLKIEKPQHKPIVITRMAAGLPKVTHKTIGDFYDAIDEALQSIPLPPFKTDRQHALDIGNLGTGYTLFKVINPAGAREALRLIKEQGEGTDVSVEAKEYGGELAHYYAFEQFVRGVEYGKVDGKWKIIGDLEPLPADEIRHMSPIPEGGYPGVDEVEQFNAEYFAMLDDLQRAWEIPNNTTALKSGVDRMYMLTAYAQTAMETKRESPFPPGFFGPTFRPPTAVDARPGAVAPLAVRAAAPARAPARAAPPDYARVQEILTEAVGSATIGVHGNFWLNMTRDDFVRESILGQKLVVARPDGTFDPDASAVVKALEGRAPFGRNVVPRPAGAIFNRMPSGGKPPVPQQKIDEIRQWIIAGCPDRSHLLAARVSRASTRMLTDQQHNDFWRQFDDVFLFARTPQITADLNQFMSNAPAYFAFVNDQNQEPAWQAALSDAPTREALLRLESGQRGVILQHYGPSLSVQALFDGYEKFGAGTLPDDPLRPQAPRHQMDGEVMWCFWSAFVDGCLRLSPRFASIPEPFWQALARAVLLGLCNDGLIRGRFTVNGFPNPDQQLIRQYVDQTAADALRDELARRCRESGLL